MWIYPKKGDKLYIGSSYHISRGSELIHGGLATVETIRFSDYVTADHYNYVFVLFEEAPLAEYNLNYILENQEKWKLKFGDSIAHPDPDIDMPWIESGDFVDRKEYDGPDVW